MLETAIALIVGFALGYGVREWAFRQYRRAEQSGVPSDRIQNAALGGMGCSGRKTPALLEPND